MNLQGRTIEMRGTRNVLGQSNNSKDMIVTENEKSKLYNTAQGVTFSGIRHGTRVNQD